MSMLYGANVSFARFLVRNLIPVTLGNAVAAIIFVATVYWYIYDFPLRWPLKDKEKAKASPAIELKSPLAGAPPLLT
jgi:hypothetical protein